MNPCTLGWYLPLLVKDVPGALQPSDGDRISPGPVSTDGGGGGRRAKGEFSFSSRGDGQGRSKAARGANFFFFFLFLHSLFPSPFFLVYDSGSKFLLLAGGRACIPERGDHHHHHPLILISFEKLTHHPVLPADPLARDGSVNAAAIAVPPGRGSGNSNNNNGTRGTVTPGAPVGWKELDAKFRRDLPDEAYVGRLAYRGLVMRACPAIRLLDGVEVSQKERDKADKLLRSVLDARRGLSSPAPNPPPALPPPAAPVM